LVAAAKFVVEATKNSFVVPNFVAVTKPFFFRDEEQYFMLVKSLLNILTDLLKPSCIK